MAFIEEAQSKLDALIGRRFPLAVIMIMATVTAAYMGDKELVAGLIPIDGIVLNAYYRDVSAEKQTIKMVGE
jgi:uncharacterized membrane protein YkvI